MHNKKGPQNLVSNHYSDQRLHLFTIKLIGSNGNF